MRTRPFEQIDVFTAHPYLGNPLAVVLDGSDLSDAEMQQFARWTNLSETTFLLPPTEPGADYRVRIFTPGGELPFAGHPTLGTCRAWLQAGGVPKQAGRIVQQCAVGLVNLQQDAATGRLAFAAPALRRSPVEAAQLHDVVQALGLQPQQVQAAQWLDNGPVWLGLWLDDPDTVLALTPDHARLKALGVKVGVAARYRAEATPPLIGRRNREAQAFSAPALAAAQAAAPSPHATPTDTPDLEVRAFAMPIGVEEDPVTGSLNASLAQWLMADGLMPERYLASQGVCLGRAGLVYVSRDAQGQVWVGGDSVRCISGSVTL